MRIAPLVQSIRTWLTGVRERLTQPTPLGDRDEAALRIIGVDPAKEGGDRTVIRLVDRAAFRAGSHEVTTEMIERWGRQLRGGRQGRIRNAVLVLEREDGSTLHLTNGANGLCAVEVVGLLHYEQHRILTDGGNGCS